MLAGQYMKRIITASLALALSVAISTGTTYAKEKAQFIPNSLNNTEEMESRLGMVGRFYIPDIEINVALFNVDGADYTTKAAYADAEDSGLWYIDKDMVVIGDHAYQGFGASKDVVPGETLCYIQCGEEITIYQCAAKGTGINTTKALLDENGERLRDREGYSFMTYCCADSSGEHIYYTFWIPYVPEETESR